MVPRSHPLSHDVPWLGWIYPSRAWLSSALCVVALSVLVVQCAAVPRGPFTCDGVQVHLDELTRPEAEAYCRYAVQERKKVEGFWGAMWSTSIRIHVSSVYHISRALVPSHLGNRGLIEMPLQRTRQHTGALLHEIVHVYAPNSNRFPAEGLAVYLHTTLAENPAFPNFGEDLQRLAVWGVSGVNSLEALNRLRTPRPLGTVMDEKTAYIVAGSFVGFVIERYSLALFRRLYETENYEQVYRPSTPPACVISAAVDSAIEGGSARAVAATAGRQTVVLPPVAGSHTPAALAPVCRSLPPTCLLGESAAAAAGGR